MSRADGPSTGITATGKLMAGLWLALGLAVALGAYLIHSRESHTTPTHGTVEHQDPLGETPPAENRPEPATVTAVPITPAELPAPPPAEMTELPHDPTPAEVIVPPEQPTAQTSEPAYAAETPAPAAPSSARTADLERSSDAPPTPDLPEAEPEPAELPPATHTTSGPLPSVAPPPPPAEQVRANLPSSAPDHGQQTSVAPLPQTPRATRPSPAAAPAEEALAPPARSEPVPPARAYSEAPRPYADPQDWRQDGMLRPRPPQRPWLTPYPMYPSTTSPRRHWYPDPYPYQTPYPTYPEPGWPATPYPGMNR